MDMELHVSGVLMDLGQLQYEQGAYADARRTVRRGLEIGVRSEFPESIPGIESGFPEIVN